MDLSDGDLARLARDGDPVAFRLLVERHQPMARARAARLCANPSDVDDVVQESFLQAFVALDRLRDPDRFAGWLAGIVLNVGRRLHRQAPLTLLADWPEPLHPAAADGLPSADDLDRAAAVRAAVAGLPAGQRRAVALHYYADLPAAQIAEPASAARVSLHKARLRLRAYLTEHRPDLVPAASRRTPMTTVRIARAESRLPPGEPLPVRSPTHVIVLADDAGHRELPLWLLGFDGHRLTHLFDQAAARRAEQGTGPGRETGPAGGSGPAGTPRARTADELTVELLDAAGVRVTRVDLDELGPEVTAARIELTGPAGTRHVTARLAEGLALAITTGAQLQVAGSVLDRLSVPAAGEGEPAPPPGSASPDPSKPPGSASPAHSKPPGTKPPSTKPSAAETPGPGPSGADTPGTRPSAAETPGTRPSGAETPGPGPSGADMPLPGYAPPPVASVAPARRRLRPRYEPRNLEFDGLDGWLFGGSFTEHASQAHWHDYSCSVADGVAVLSAAVPHPEGFAMLGQEMFADDYQGATVVFRGEFRTAGRAGLFLRVNEGHPVMCPLTERSVFADPDNNIVTITAGPAWTSHEVTARVPDDGDAIVFGIFLAGPGRIELRHPELIR